MTTPKPKPWLRNRERAQRREVAICDAPPVVQLCIYPDMVVLTRRDARGGWRSYPIDPAVLCQRLSQLPLSSGLLPPDALGWGMANGAPYLVCYLPPHRATMAVLQSGSEQHYTVQLPPLIWAGCGGQYRIFALPTAERPTRNMPLCVAPFPNCYDNGGICWGSADRPPTATAETMLPAFEVFVRGSYFNSHVVGHKSKQFPTNVLQQWQQQADRPDMPYPLDDLEPARVTLAQLLSGEIWQQGGGA
jgi:PRTRC genetic system protein B